MIRFLLSLSILAVTSVHAQVNVKFIIKERPSTHTTDTIYIAGSFNNWNPQDNKYILSAEVITLPLRPGYHEYKFTRGGWSRVEISKNGNEIPNRSISLTKDTTIEIAIGGWRDDVKGPVIERKHTASKQVMVMDTAFKIPQLNRSRRIWIYLPEDYNRSKKKFPVLYMHDGQNLFDEYTSGFGEWGVDECLDSLFRQGVRESIVVGIDNGPRRMSEYNPYEFKPVGAGEGDQYLDFIVKTLKPFIDDHYRTLKDKKNTFIAGSSMGGLISFYAVMRYPEVFGAAGVFSPAFQTALGIEADFIKVAPKVNSKIYFYAGGREGESMIPNMQKIEEDVKKLSPSKTVEKLDMEQRHHESAWRKYFPDFYRWIVR